MYSHSFLISNFLQPLFWKPPSHRKRFGAATHCRVIRSWAWRCVLQQCIYFFFFFFGERQWAWLASSLQQGPSPPGCSVYLFIYLCDGSLKTGGSSSKTQSSAPHTFLVYMNPTFIVHRVERKKKQMFGFIFPGVVTFKTLLWKTVAPEQISYCPCLCLKTSICAVFHWGITFK